MEEKELSTRAHELLNDVDTAVDTVKTAVDAVKTSVDGVTTAVKSGASFTAVASGTADAQAVSATTGLRLMGFSVLEDAATPAAAELNLRHGTADTDPVTLNITLAASGSQNIWFGPGGIEMASGIFVERLSGTSRITVFTRTVT